MTEQTVFTSQTPSLQNFSDGVPYELGMKFQSTTAGQITAIRFWKAASEIGSHTGKIWAAGGGTLLATVTFSNETASGWQQQALSTPLTIQANTTYVVSVNVNSHYPITENGLASSFVNGNLSSVADGNNGVYNTSPGSFPTNSWRNSNYYRDIVFVAGNNPPPASGNQSLFTTQAPQISNETDGVPYELGMKFRSTQAGQITAIRYWKAPSDTGMHVGKIWSSTGSLLASVAFSNETTSGWQQQALSTPLNIQANTTYVVSVNINSHYATTNNGLASSVINGSLSSVADGNNGVYNTSPGSFPTNSWQNSNYYRDIVFVTGNFPTITKVSGDNQSGKVGTTLANPLVVQVKDGAGNLKSGVTVNFAVISGGGAVSPTSAVTNTNGQASTMLTLGTTSGATNTVSATVSSIGSVTFTAKANVANPNPIYLENQKAGTRDWQITDYALNSEIAGYAGAISVNKGGTLPIKVSLGQPGQFTINVYRLGYYGGSGGRLVVSSGLLNGVTQAACSFNSTTRLIACNWSTSYTIAVGTDWTSGLYIAKLTDQRTGKQSLVWFVVRDDSSTSDILFQSSFTTAQAYNNYGGYSLYDFNSTGGQRAYAVSFDRPFGQGGNIEAFNIMLTWEYNMVRWLESQGYDVCYYTNLDVHANPQLLQQHKVFLSVGHDEYWSMEMRNYVEQARNNGINLAFFSANTAYWRVRFQPSSTGQANRVMVAYKQDWANDPVAQTNSSQATDVFRSSELNRPENALLGVMYIGDWGGNNAYSGFDFVVSNSSDPYYAHTGLQNGDQLTGLVGYEWDAVVNNGFTPAGSVILSQSPVSPTGALPTLPPGTNINISNAVRYTAASGAKVFSTGSIQWVWGLDSDNVLNPRTDPRVQQIAVNVLADMGAKPQSPDANIIVP